MREIDLEEVFQNIKQQIMDEEDLDESDLDDDWIEDTVNRLAKARFKSDWGFDYDDLED